MPCRVYDNPEQERRENQAQAARELAKAKTEINDLTRMLCSTLKALQTGDPENENSIPYDYVLSSVGGLQQWWSQHREDDKVHAQKDIAALMKSMTADQLDALVKQAEDIASRKK
jgi:K+-transporting ATPase c subunit